MKLTEGRKAMIARIAELEAKLEIVSDRQTLPSKMTPEMMRAVQIKSELGGYAASELSGAYDMFAEFWGVACSAAQKQEEK